MHGTTKLLVGVCAAAFAATTAAAQTTTRDTTITRHHRHIAGSGIRVTKEGSETTTGTASGVLATPSSDTASSAATTSSSSASINGNSGSVNSNPTVNPGSKSFDSSCAGTACSSVSSSNGTLVPANPDTMAAGDVDMAMFGAPDTQLLHGMTDENILAHLFMGDSMEIRMAQHALQQTRDQRVRDFANTLIADHTASLQQDQAAAQQAGLTPQLAVGDTAGMRMMDHMNMNMSGSMNMSGNMSGSMNMSGHHMMAYSDANFIRHNVMLNRHMLSELQTLSGVAKNDAVRNKVNNTIPVVQTHLSMARQLATDLHVDLNARMK